ncbi:hypothetical protein [Labilithrix luteola]|nr:hypothetical protein [Labilithrix luteola]
MMDRLPTTGSTRSTLRRAWLGAFGTMLAVTFACSNGEERIAIGSGENGDASAPTQATFTPPPDAGEAADAQTPLLKPEMCMATECPAPYATCAAAGGFGTVYACQTNLLSDKDNCGACGNKCPASSTFPEMNMETRCVDGACARQCVSSGTSQFQDCNGLVDDGCETNLANNPDNCGGCGIVCPVESDGGRRCISGKCGCPDGKTWCNGQCVDLSVDDTNCGACGNQCQGTDAGPPPPNMEYRCQMGKCAQLTCSKGWADCNGIINDHDGCEVAIQTDRNNCGTCGNVCPPDQECLKRGDAVGCGCEPLETLCRNGAGEATCVDLLNDPRNCGACGYSCPSKGSYAASCKKGFCEFECPPGWGDCDGDASNGCETNLLIDGLHCGSCNNQCNTAAGQPCVAGACLMRECDAGPVTK